MRRYITKFVSTNFTSLFITVMSYMNLRPYHKNNVELGISSIIHPIHLGRYRLIDNETQVNDHYFRFRPVTTSYILLKPSINV